MRAIGGILVAAAFFAAMYFATLRETGTRCEVCLRFQGREACESVAGPDRAHAVQQATASVCARVSSGVTDGMACSQTPPLSVRCE